MKYMLEDCIMLIATRSESNKQNIKQNITYFFIDFPLCYDYNIHCSQKHVPVAQPDRVFGYEPKGRGFESLQARGNKVRACQTKSGLFYALKLDFTGYHPILLKSIHSEINGFLCVYDGL